MHLIKTHHINFSCHEKELALEVKEQMPAVLRQEFYPKLEALLDHYDVHDQICEIANLPIAIQLDTTKNWKQKIVEQSLDQVAIFLESKSLHFSLETKKNGDRKEGSMTTQSRKIYVQKLLLSYLVTASVPANSLGFGLKEIFEEIVIDAQFVSKLKEVCRTNSKVVLRWFLNIPPRIKQGVINLFSGESMKLKKEVIANAKEITKKLKIEDAAVVKSVNEYIAFLSWNYVLQEQKTGSVLEIDVMTRIAEVHFGIKPSFFTILVEKKKYNKSEITSSFENFLFQMAEKVVEQQKPSFVDTTVLETFNALQKEQKKQKIQELQNDVTILSEQFTEPNNAETEGCYINNAGLVLLHPFLAPLFENLGYLDNQQWKTTALQHRAVLVTQYLISFDQEVYESELAFNKLLCGVSFKEPIATDWRISEEEIKECRSLLTSVIEHWKILKNTSPEGLQHTFLQREGKLTQLKNGNYQMTVAQTGVDVLLDQLPWGLGMIKTPWMECFVDCIWN